MQEHYIDYSGLKDLIKAQADQGTNGQMSYSPRTTSLTIQRYNNKSNRSEEAFFKKLEADVGGGGCMRCAAWGGVLHGGGFYTGGCMVRGSASMGEAWRGMGRHVAAWGGRAAHEMPCLITHF